MRSIAPPGRVVPAGMSPDVLDVAATRAAMDHLDCVHSVAEAAERRQTELVGRLVSSSWWRLEGARSPAAWLMSRLGIDDEVARRLVRRAELCLRLRSWAAAYETGEVPSGHVDRLARAVGNCWDKAVADEDALLAAALDQGPTEWADTVADWAARQRPVDAEQRWVARSVRLGHDLFGDLHGTFCLPGDDGHAVAAAIDAATPAPDPERFDGPEPRSLAARRADALIGLVCGEGESRTPATVVIVDRELLERPTPAPPPACTPATAQPGGVPAGSAGAHGAAAGAAGPAAPPSAAAVAATVRNGRPVRFDARKRCDHQSVAITPSAARRLGCEATVTVARADAAGTVLSLGRATRTFTSTQRRALAVRWRRCAFKHCDVAFHRCEIHHRIPWAEGGRTDLDNAVPLCRYHHHLVHDDGWVHPHRRHDGLPPPDTS